MLFSSITVLRADGTLQDNQTVAVHDGRIVYVGSGPAPMDCMPSEGFAQRIEGKNRLMIPGLVNSHTHVAMTLMRGYGEDMPLQSWLHDRIFPFEDRLTGEDVYWGSLFGIAEMLQSGTTSFTDMYFYCDEVVRAVDQTGIRANIGRGITCFDPDKRFEQLPAAQETKELLETAHGRDNGRIRIDVAPHAEYTTRPDILTGALALAESYGARLHIHLSETRAEQLACVGRYGVTPTRLLEKLGLLERPLTAAHGVWLTEGDRETLAAHPVTVAHCPKSNLKLGSGVAPIENLRRAGVAVAIGTDSAASNNALNMLEEIRFASLLAKGLGQDPEALPAKTAFFLATRAGALSQGRPDCGDIAPGYRADLVLLDKTVPAFVPAHDPLSSLIFAADPSAVRMTMVDGRVLYQDGVFPTIDIERVHQEVTKRAEKLGKMA